MNISWPKVFRNLVLLAIVMLVAVIILFNIFIKDNNQYREIILNYTEEYTGYNLTFSSTELLYFPFPGIRFNNVSVAEGEKKLAEFSNFDVRLYWRTLISDTVLLKAVLMKDGFMDFRKVTFKKLPAPRTQRGNVFLNKLQFENISMLVGISPGIEHEIRADHAWLKIDRDFQEGELEFHGHVNGDRFFTRGNYEFKNGIINYENLVFDFQLTIENFALDLFGKYLEYFKYADFRPTTLSGDIVVSKQDENRINFISHNRGKNFCFRGGEPFGDILLEMLVHYDHDKKDLVFKSVNVLWSGLIDSRLQGKIHFGKTVSSGFVLTSKYINYDLTIKLIELFTPFPKKPDPYLATHKSRIVWDYTNVTGYGIHFDSLKGVGYYKDPVLNVDHVNLRAFDGNLGLRGNVYLYPVTEYDLLGEIKGMNLEKVIGHFTSDKYLSGNLNAEFRGVSRGNRDPDFLKNLNMAGSLSIKNGNMDGYANLLQPVASLGKLVNFLGPKGKSTEFSELRSDFNAIRRKFRFKNIKLQGVGIDASGEGTISMDSDIDMRIRVGLAGPLGKLVSVPVIYRGKMPQNSAFVDPVWLSTTYIGMTILAVPAGGVVWGALIGGAVSDYVHSAWDGMKKMFRKDKQPQKSGNK